MNFKSNMFLYKIGFVTFLNLGCQSQSSQVQSIGSMRSSIHENQIYGKANIDSLVALGYNYGLGPCDYLSGEIMLWEGQVLTSHVTKPDVQEVSVHSTQVKAPFFVYSKVSNWKTIRVPKQINNNVRLEQFLNQYTDSIQTPFTFRLNGQIDSAVIHIVNLPKGKTVHNHDEAHEGQENFLIINQKVDILGYFSTQHQGVFTHHDSFVHLHLKTVDNQSMGHAENLFFDPDKMVLQIGY